MFFLILHENIYSRPLLSGLPLSWLTACLKLKIWAQLFKANDVVS